MLIEERHVAHVPLLAQLAQRDDVRREALAHEEPEVDAQPAGDRLVGGADQVGPAGVVGADRVAVRAAVLGHPAAEVGDEVVRQVGAVGDPGEHAHLVVELDADDGAAARLQPRREHRQDRVVPPRGLGEERRRQVVDRPRRRLAPVPADRDDLGVLVVDAVGDALVLQLGHHEGTGAGDEPQPALGAQVDEGRHVALGPGGAGDVDRAVGQLVEEPGDVRRHGRAAGLDDQVETLLPLVAGDAEVVDLAGHHQARLAVDDDLLVADLDHGRTSAAVTRSETCWRVAASGPVSSSTSPSSTRSVSAVPK